MKREELQSLGDGELSTVSQQNYALGLIVESCISQLGSKKYDCENYSKLLDEVRKHVDGLKVESETLTRWIAEEAEARNKTQEVMRKLKEWFDDLEAGYCQLLKDRIRQVTVSGGSQYVGNSRAFRRVKKRGEKKWNAFIVSLDRAVVTERESHWSALYEKRALCDYDVAEYKEKKEESV